MVLTTIITGLARLIGWSAVGKCIALRIDEASDILLYDRQYNGSLEELNPGGFGIIELDTPIVLSGKAISRVLVVPRHRGHDFSYLWWDSITVNLFDADGVGTYALGAARMEGWFAIGSLRVGRHRGQP